MSVQEELAIRRRITELELKARTYRRMIEARAEQGLDDSDLTDGLSVVIAKLEVIESMLYDRLDNES